MFLAVTMVKVQRVTPTTNFRAKMHSIIAEGPSRNAEFKFFSWGDIFQLLPN